MRDMAIIKRKVESYTEYPDGSWEVLFGEPEEDIEWPDELDFFPSEAIEAWLDDNYPPDNYGRREWP